MRPKSKSVLVKGAEEVSHETETFAAYPATDPNSTLSFDLASASSVETTSFWVSFPSDADWWSWSRRQWSHLVLVRRVTLTGVPIFVLKGSSNWVSFAVWCSALGVVDILSILSWLYWSYSPHCGTTIGFPREWLWTSKAKASPYREINQAIHLPQQKHPPNWKTVRNDNTRTTKIREKYEVWS